MRERRRGRPRNTREKIDKGTPELQCKRNDLLQQGRPQDTSLAESLLGVLYAQRLISKPLYEAGCVFGELRYSYVMCLGCTFQKRSHALALRFGECGEDRDPLLSEHQREKRTKAWRDALRVLQQAGSAPYEVVLKTVCYDEDLYTAPALISSFKEVEALRQGLGCLDKYFTGVLKDRRGTPDDPAPGPARSTRFPHVSKDPPPFPLPPHRWQEHHAP